MLTRTNWLYRLILPRFFRHISVDPYAVEQLRVASQEATLVYVGTHLSLLEYSYFNHLLLEQGLPLARYTNELTLRRWMPCRKLWKSICRQQEEIAEHDQPLDPLDAGMLADMIREGQSVLIRVPPKALEEQDLLHTGPIHAMREILRARVESQRPLKIVTLDVLWSRRAPSSKRSIIDLLFGETETPGRIRKIVLFWRNAKRRAHVSVGSPVEVQSIIDAHPDATEEELASELLSRVLSTIMNRRHTITGPKRKPRSWFIEEVLADETLDRAICQIATEQGKSIDDARALAHRYIKEIAGDLDDALVELLDRFLGGTLIRLFDAFDVDRAGLEEVKALFEKGPVIFVPNHKSHVDYLILSFILYHHGMAIPFVAAGKNLSFWPLGPIFRRCRAYFIRRTFRGNTLYRDVLMTYLTFLLKEGHCQEFFIEGGRSRTGKLRQPRMGMLRMLLQAAQAAGQPKLTFVPVCITYDRIIEHKSYVREAEGEMKEQERFRHLIKLTKFLRRPKVRYGSIYVRFGTCLTHESSIESAETMDLFAQQICREINRKAVITPASVAAAALLASETPGVTHASFRENANALLSYLDFRGCEIPRRLQTETQPVLGETLEELELQRLLRNRPSALEPYLHIESSKRLPLSYYRNTIVHYFTSIGVLCSLLLKQQQRDTLLTIEQLVGSFQACQKLLRHELHFGESKDPLEHVRRHVSYLESCNAVKIADDGSIIVTPGSRSLLELFASQVRPFLEPLWIALRYVEDRLPLEKEEQEIVEDLLRDGLDLFLLGHIRFRESMTKDASVNAIQALCQRGILICTSRASKKREHRFFQRGEEKSALENLKVELEKIL